MAEDAQNHVLYRMRDCNRQLLYVGITMHVHRRLRRHSREKLDWREVVRIDLEHFETRAELEAAESKAIRTERPRWNIAAGRSPVPTQQYALHHRRDAFDKAIAIADTRDEADGRGRGLSVVLRAAIDRYVRKHHDLLPEHFRD